MTGKSLKVLLLITSLEMGGAQKQLIHLAVALKKHNIDILFVSLMSEDMNPTYQQQLAAADIPLLTLDAKRGLIDPWVVVRVARIAGQFEADIIHSFLVHSNFVARLARLLYPRPKQISSARSIIEGGRMRELVYRLTDPLCHITSQNSTFGADRYIRVKAVPAQKMRVLRNVVDTTQFRPDLSLRRQTRADLALEDAFVWLAVGRLVPVKNYPLLLTAFSQVYVHNPPMRLLVVGDGPEEASLRQLSHQLNIDGGVQFLGARHNVHEIMNAADAYVLTSSWEGTSNVLMEASATALPIIATDVGGNSEVVIDGVTGFLVESEHADKLQNKMNHMMSLSPAIRQQIGQAGRKHIEAQYNIDTNVSHWLALYDEVLAGG